MLYQWGGGGVQYEYSVEYLLTNIVIETETIRVMVIINHATCSTTITAVAVGRDLNAAQVACASQRDYYSSRGQPVSRAVSACIQAHPHLYITRIRLNLPSPSFGLKLTSIYSPIIINSASLVSACGQISHHRPLASD